MKNHKGEVTGVRQHHTSTKHVVVEVAHGRRSPKKKKGKYASPDYDDRPSSSMVVPKAHASKFPVGKKVSLSMDPQADADGDQGEDLVEMGERLKRARRS